MKTKKSTKTENKKEFLARVARLYYTLDMSQKEIATQLGIGRSSVGRFLNEAKEAGIVQIQIASESDTSRRHDLELQLTEKYSLRESFVVSRTPGNSFETIVMGYIDSILPFQGCIGLGGGRTLYELGQYIHLCDKRPNLRIVQLSGNAGKVPSTSVIQSWAQAIDATPVFIHAPALVQDKAARKTLMETDQFKESYREIKKIELSITCLGATDVTAAILYAELLPGLTSEILSKNCAGDISFHFYNSKGEFALQQISELILGASTTDYLAIPVRVGIVYGPNKIEAIKGALNGRLINILITDEETAQSVLS